MQSIQSRLINFMLRNRHFFSGKFRKEVYTMETSIEAFRLLCEKGAERYAKIPDDVVIKPFDINHMKAERSDEHTSEIQARQVNSYAVFCLKKTKKR